MAESQTDKPVDLKAWRDLLLPGIYGRIAMLSKETGRNFDFYVAVDEKNGRLVIKYTEVPDLAGHDEQQALVCAWRFLSKETLVSQMTAAAIQAALDALANDCKRFQATLTVRKP